MPPSRPCVDGAAGSAGRRWRNAKKGPGEPDPFPANAVGLEACFEFILERHNLAVWLVLGLTTAVTIAILIAVAVPVTVPVATVTVPVATVIAIIAAITLVATTVATGVSTVGRSAVTRIVTAA